MKFLISINSIGFNVPPELLVQVIKHIDTGNAVEGIELNANVFDGVEREYLMRMAHATTANGLLLQIHAPGPETHCASDEKIDRLLETYDKVARITGQPARVVFHPVSSANCELAMELTQNYIETILLKIDNKGLLIVPSLENLNDTSHLARLGTKQIDSLLANTGMGFCWDVGHDVISGNDSYRLPKGLEKSLENVHIHDVSDTDHCPFYHFNTDFVKTLRYLEHIGYKESVVLEININKLNASSTFQRYHEYIGNLMMIRSYRQQWLVEDISSTRGYKGQEVV
ncbi:hypothetical protein EAL2_c21190 [Peptoclostridium acidaminophilum DSM 3953]|uniref:Xylose isomerase-like TIM barrel domain-containing protein n=1 Tax=Peptoclostridium acidaminophilum DSM 3953 TaxID=1286171 RepID=W8T915_PEPAC|nr:sugar phosphate isomerase/epimerase [Peptoclostridium acidaminophilum]AHM57400.1 hypothetical protein EAL2_c21190 [Peptoclostridium acidaminophilum DSM 3953]